MKNSWTRWLTLLIALVCFGIAAFFAWKIYSTQQENAESDAIYDAIAQAVSTEEPAETEALDESLGLSAEPEETIGATTEERVLSVDFGELMAINDEVVGWLHLPDSVINYPVVQGSDNICYLKHLLDGTYNNNGCLFIDCKNKMDFSDDNTLIYGHHMDSGKMFASLVKYKEQSYYDTHQVVYFSTPEQDFMIEIFSGYVTSVDSSAYMISWSSREEKIEWLKDMFHNSDFYSELTVYPDEHIVTLSTCDYTFQNARYVVHGRLVEIAD